MADTINTDTEPRDLHLSAYNWTAARAAGGREVWQIDAGNEWHTREDAEAAIARHEARIRADERAKCEAETERLRAALVAVGEKLTTAFDRDIADASDIVDDALYTDRHDLLRRRNAAEPKGLA